VNEQDRPARKRTRRRKRSTGDPALGLRVRKARIKAGLSQEQAAHQIERSDRWLLSVENGDADPGYGDLVQLAPVLGVGFDQLVLEEQTERVARHETRADMSGTRQPDVASPSDAAMIGGDGIHPPDQRLEELRRRGFLQAGLVVTGGVVLGLWPAFEERTESTDMAALRRVLLDYGPAKVTELPDVGTLRSTVRAAWADRQQARYSSVLRVAPSILRQVRTATEELNGGDRDGSLELLAQTYRLIFDLLRKVGDNNLATIAADRGMVAAQQNGHPAVIASATGCLRAVLSAGRHHARAIEMATSAAANLEPVAVRGGSPEDLSTYGNILLSGAEAAVQAGDGRLSNDFYREADDVARRLGQDANHSFTAFGPTNIAVHRVHAAIVLGDGERAVRMARDLDLTRLPVLERQAHHLLDVAIAYGLIENPESALDSLVAAEQIAPEEVRLDPRARALVDELRRRNRHYGSQLGALEQRMFPHT
jgi:transcriptional regulator with XRE-family HTH domain